MAVRTLAACALASRWTSTAATATVSTQEDAGFELLFQDVLEECENVELKFKGNPIPDYVKGLFVQQGPARWTWGNRSMTHLLDGYAKGHTFDFKSDGKVTYTSKFLETGFYKRSKATNDITFGVFAQPLEPPLEYKFPQDINTFIDAPNDNNQVNNMMLGDGNLLFMSDTVNLIETHPSLEWKAEYQSMKCPEEAAHCRVETGLDVPAAHTPAGGSAHPFFYEGDYIGLHQNVKAWGAMPLVGESLVVYRIKKDNRSAIENLVKVDVDKASYTHSFGLTRGQDGPHVIIAQQPVYFDLFNLIQHGTLDIGFYAKKQEETKMYIAPLKAGAKATEVTVPYSFFFGHMVNSYQSGPDKFVVDINQQYEIFFDRFSLDVMKNKTWRDTWAEIPSKLGRKPGYMTPTRVEIDLKTKEVTSKPIFGKGVLDNKNHEQDLFLLHPDDEGKPYCGYWSWRLFYNSSSFASWAIVRNELCNGEPHEAAAWYRPNVYVGEARLVPKPGSNDKTEGVLIFRTLNGNTGKSELIIADAKTLETIAEAELPVRIPFTVHANFYPAKTTEEILV